MALFVFASLTPIVLIICFLNQSVRDINLHFFLENHYSIRSCLFEKT